MADLGDYQAIVVGDTITTLLINEHWRKLLISAILQYFNTSDSGVSRTNEQTLLKLIEDLYD